METAGRLVEQGVNYNVVLIQKKEFRHPSYLERFICESKLDQLGTNFPPNLYDGHMFGEGSYYDELLMAQDEEMDRRHTAVEARERVKVALG